MRFEIFLLVKKYITKKKLKLFSKFDKEKVIFPIFFYFSQELNQNSS